jgi:hypothetical protein
MRAAIDVAAVHGYQNQSGPPDPQEVALRRARLRELLPELFRQPARTSAEIELDDVASTDPDRALFVSFVEAERCLVAARRHLNELREQEQRIVDGVAGGDLQERARRVSDVRREIEMAVLAAGDADRLYVAADRRCEPARARQHGRRVAAAVREMREWETAREEKLERMRQLQREADAIHAELLGVDGLYELSQRRAAVEALMRGGR